MKLDIGYFKKLNQILSFAGRGRVILVLLGILIASALELLGVSVIYPFIDLLLSNHDGVTMTVISPLCEKVGLEPIWMITLLIILLYLVKNIYILLYNRFEIRTFYKLQHDLATKLMHSYMRQPYTFFLQENSAFLLKGVQWDVPQFCSALRSLMVICSHSLLALFLIAFLLVTDVKLTCFVIAVIGVCMLFFYLFFRKKAQHYGDIAQGCYKDIYRWSDEALGGIKEIKIMHREPFFIKGFEAIYKRFSNANGKFAFINLFPRLILETVCITAIVLLITVEIKGGQNAAEYIPTLSVFAMAFFRMFPRIGEISTSYNNIMYSKASVEDVHEILNRVNHEAEAVKSFDNNESVSFERELSIKNLSYTYEAEGRKILDNLNFVVKKGSAIAFTGASGAGKTTLIHLLLGLLKPTEGAVYSDDTDVHGNSGFRHKIGYVPQMIFIADDTIRNNVVFGAHPYDESKDEEVWAALEEAKIADLVRSFPEGLNTTIGENGVRLSGGERQRLGIARALYHKPEILIMDEATSSLDYDTEKAIIETIAYFKGKKTLIIIAHRFSTIQDCDIIYKVENGGIQEISYRELQQGQ